MASLLESSDCPLCRQRRVLGEFKHIPSVGHCFRCCACIDQFGDEDEIGSKNKEIAHVRNSVASVASDQVDACTRVVLELPNCLWEVPMGELTMSQTCLDALDGQVHIVSVLDPAHNYFSGVGAERVWPAASSLTQYMVRKIHNGCTVVELGAGSGFVGIALAKLGARVLLTDVPWFLPLTRYNIEANFTQGDPNTPGTLPLRWGSGSDANAVSLALNGLKPDFIIGSDIVYEKALFTPLIETLTALQGKETYLGLVDRGRNVAKFLQLLPQASWRFHLCGRAGLVSILQLKSCDAPCDQSRAIQLVPLRAQRKVRQAASALGRAGP